MAKRMFNEDEKRLAHANLDTIGRDIEHIEWLIQYNQLMVDKGLEMNFKEKLRAFKKQLKMDKDELDMKKLTFDTLSDQIENGVEEIEVKDENPEVEEGE